MKYSLFAILVLFSLPGGAGSGYDANTIYDQAARKHDISSYLLYAVSLVESQSLFNDEFVRPWPWTLNVRGQALRFDTQKQARQYLKKEVDKGNLDIAVGLMQIYLRYHREHDPVALLDPLKNVMTGAAILRECLDRNKHDVEIAVGCYNASSPDKARRYGRQVINLAGRLVVYLGSMPHQTLEDEKIL